MISFVDVWVITAVYQLLAFIKYIVHNIYCETRVLYSQTKVRRTAQSGHRRHTLRGPMDLSMVNSWSLLKLFSRIAGYGRLDYTFHSTVHTCCHCLFTQITTCVSLSFWDAIVWHYQISAFNCHRHWYHYSSCLPCLGSVKSCTSDLQWSPCFNARLNTAWTPGSLKHGKHPEHL